MTDQPDPTRQPAYDAVFAYIHSQPRDFMPGTVVERNAMIWHAVNAALDAMAEPAPDDETAQCPRPEPHAPHMWTWREEGVDCPGLPAARTTPDNPAPYRVCTPCPTCDHTLLPDGNCEWCGPDAPTELGTPAANANETTRHVGASSVGEPATADDGLREQYAAALWEAGGPAAAEDVIVDAVMRVRDRRMEQLAAGRETWKHKAAEIEADRDRLDRTRPTTWAYEQACKALEKHRKRADDAEATIAHVRAYITGRQSAWPDRYPVVVPASDVIAALDAPQRCGGGPRGDCPRMHPADDTTTQEPTP